MNKLIRFLSHAEYKIINSLCNTYNVSPVINKNNNK